MKRTKPIVAVDGPVGAGKTTTARHVAQKLGFAYIDTGAMYRAVTLDVLGRGVDPGDETGVAAVAGKSEVRLEFEDGVQHTFLNDADVSERIRERDVTNAVSAVSAMLCVRERMWELQRLAGAPGGVVMEGRDIGTVVFPDAEVKVYLDAAVEVRARRRYDELVAKGREMPFETLMDEIRERDRANSERAIAPLKQADDAIRLDTSDMTFDEQVDAVVALVQKVWSD